MEKFRQAEKKLSTYPWLTIVLTLALCALIIALRKRGSFLNAQFWAEDGLIWFQQAYDNGFWRTIFEPYSGTISVVTRMAGYLATQVPLLYAPLLFNVAALLGHLLPVLIINSARFRHIVRYRVIALLASLMYVCVTNAGEVFLNLANIQWHLGVAAFLVLISAAPKRLIGKIFDTAVLVATGLTGPLSITLVPVAFVIWWRNRTASSLRNFTIIAATALVQVFSLLVLAPGERGGSTPMSIVNLIKMWVGQIFTAGTIGEQYIYTFYSNISLYVVFAIGVAIIIYAVRKGPSWIRYAWIFALTLFTLTVPSLHPVNNTDVWALLTQMGAGRRYWYIIILAWLATLLWTALAARNMLMRTVCGLLMLLFVFVGVPGSWKIPPWPDKNYRHYVHEFNKLKTGQKMVIPINPDGWAIHVRKR